MRYCLLTINRFCERLHAMNKAAQQLGKMARGVQKTLTKAERKRRSKRLALARAKRWPKECDENSTT